jgi:hypothetical protein
MMGLANPYSNLDLRIPEHEWDSVRRFTGTFRTEDGSPTDPDRSPFSRYVDLWWAALCLGVREERRTTLDKWHTFVTGVVFNQEPWRIRFLELLALAEEGPPMLERPGEIIAMANSYAATGIPLLIDAMTGQAEPIWAVTGLFRSALEGAAGSSAPSF